jgi:Flp pilus assembly protein TadG
MISRNRASAQRCAVAAVEFAFVAPVLIGILVGLWEVGRMIQLQQILSNAAREGARVAAQSTIVNRTSAPTQIGVTTGDPNVKQTVVNYLNRAGLNLTSSDVTVDFAFTTGDTTKTEPYQGTKGQQFQVTVSVPVSSLKWTTLSFFTPSSMSSSVVWTCLVDDPFTLDTSLPSW